MVITPSRESQGLSVDFHSFLQSSLLILSSALDLQLPALDHTSALGNLIPLDLPLPGPGCMTQDV